MSQLLNEPLSRYLTDLEYAAAGNETPYLFHPTDDTSRCVTSSQWSGIVKAIMKKYTGKAAPPKLLRASFIVRQCPTEPRELRAVHTDAPSDWNDRRGCATLLTPQTC